MTIQPTPEELMAVHRDDLDAEELAQLHHAVSQDAGKGELQSLGPTYVVQRLLADLHRARARLDMAHAGLRDVETATLRERITTVNALRDELTRARRPLKRDPDATRVIDGTLDWLLRVQDETRAHMVSLGLADPIPQHDITITTEDHA
ncbi:hypothetical protein EOG37_01270 [Clavibacter michiganensis subsp. michiganensis]|uniref:hypothetical protein n=1 Tax=Clavibacter michiganensis TaxID=28447 RepID=UPI001C65374F|nr:hypothetical protein [Clavibacter michiganensis]MBW8025310.1 hypothetical protein [Clavibacter michiganensis subsp. michiganensis]